MEGEEAKGGGIIETDGATASPSLAFDPLAAQEGRERAEPPEEAAAAAAAAPPPGALAAAVGAGEGGEMKLSELCCCPGGAAACIIADGAGPVPLAVRAGALASRYAR